MHTLATSILNTLAYFDMFRYPLSKQEIKLYLDQATDEVSVTAALSELTAGGQVFYRDGFFLLCNDFSRIERRRAGNRKAKELLIKAKRIGYFLYRFPFVRGVGISGSLSKNFADDDADIDFFIITAPGRLWIARTLLHVLKKLSFLIGKEHFFCMNYFISADALTIGEKNIFTATEVVTLLPVCGYKIFEDFFVANQWAGAYYPSCYLSAGDAVDKYHPLKKITERLLSGRTGEWLDDHWMRQTTERWRTKEDRRHLNKKGDPIALKTGKQFARPAPELFQQKILDLYAGKIKKFERQLQEAGRY